MPERPKNFVDVEDNDEAPIGDTHVTFEHPADGMLVTKNRVAKFVPCHGLLFPITNPTRPSTQSSAMEVQHA